MSEINIPEELRYTEDHEWVLIEGDLAVMGLTDYAQQQLGDVTFVELPEIGMEVEQKGEMAVVESVKAAADVYSPLSGVVAEVNSALEDQPDLINSACYGDGWLVKLKDIEAGGMDNLLDAKAYRDLVAGG
ncbi:MAG: glycine cleavage system protein GcvH [Desulfarculaceae bacterium]|jgi:glycine cleavage system H protein